MIPLIPTGIASEPAEGDGALAENLQVCSDINDIVAKEIRGVAPVTSLLLQKRRDAGTVAQ